MIVLDGSTGEGGGQILRSALALSICTATPFRIHHMRAKRSKPGLLRQHLTAVRAAAEISGARISGDEVGSSELTFAPGPLRPGEYSFHIGTAGSCTLVLQTVLPPLMTASGPSRIRITGGTHNTGAPPFGFLQKAFLPLIERMGPRVKLELLNYGFYPRGGGEIVATVEPAATLRPLHMPDRGARGPSYAESLITAIPMHVAQRELETVGGLLNWAPDQLHVRGLSNDVGPGNVLSITLEHEHLTEVFTGFGEKAVTAEVVAKRAVGEVRDYLVSTGAAGPHLADQLILPMALSGAGSFTASQATLHLTTNAEVVRQFTGRRIALEKEGARVAISIG